MASIGFTKFGMADAGFGPAPAAEAPAAPVGVVATAPAGSGWRAGLSPSEPEMWVVAIGAVMFGLIAVSTSVRVGPLRASVGVGDA